MRKRPGIKEKIADLSARAREPGFSNADMPDGLLLASEPEVTVGCVITLPDGRAVPNWLAASLARVIGPWARQAAGEIRQRRLKLSDGIIS